MSISVLEFCTSQDYVGFCALVRLLCLSLILILIFFFEMLWVHILVWLLCGIAWLVCVLKCLILPTNCLMKNPCEVERRCFHFIHPPYRLSSLSLSVSLSHFLRALDFLFSNSLSPLIFSLNTKKKKWWVLRLLLTLMLSFSVNFYFSFGSVNL